MAWESEKKRIRTTLNLISAELPYLAGLAAIVEVHFDERVSTAGIFASGRMLISPRFMESLNHTDLAFVVAHELMHLFLRTHDRVGNSSHDLVNTAHDFIINEKLFDFHKKKWWGDKIPADALDWRHYRYTVPNWKPASEYSLEELVSVLMKLQQEKNADFKNRPHWELGPQKPVQQKPVEPPPPSSTLGDFLAAAGITLPETAESTGKPVQANLPVHQDVFSKEMEQQYFPNVSLPDLHKAQKKVKEAVVRAYAELEVHNTIEKLIDKQYGIDGGAGNSRREYSLLRSAYEVPWETALQQWFDATAPGQRSWARPSRRGAFRTDVVLPGRTREGWTLHIVLDTSGSMESILPVALGAIAHFCEANNVSEVRIIQIDTVIHADEFVPVEKLEGYKILGLGGNDMQPAWDRLMEDPEIEAVVVVSDGGFYVPPEPPFEVLWAILEDGWNSRSFNPNYGTVVFISQNS